MKPYSLFSVLFLGLIFFSCKSVDIKSRKGKDRWLTFRDTSLLNGVYRNSAGDSASYLYTAWIRLNPEASGNFNEADIQVRVVDDRTLKIELLSQGKVIDKKILRGKFKKGYFVFKNNYKAKLNFGPLVWTISGFKIYLGVTKQQGLVIMESNAGSTMIVLLPFFMAGERLHFEYKRKTI